MPNDRYRNLTPGAVIAALRSFPRRYESALTGDPSRGMEELGGLRTPDGRTVRQVLADTATTMQQLANSLRHVLYSVAGSVTSAADGDALSGTDVSQHDMRGWLRLLDSSALSIADLLGGVPSGDLLRTGTTAAGSEVSALDVGRQGVRVGAESLRKIEQAVGGNRTDEVGEI